MKKRIKVSPQYKVYEKTMARFSPLIDRVDKMKKTNRKKDVIVVGKKIEIGKEVVVATTMNNVGYLFFAINDAVEKYGVSHTECLVLMYLHELGGFGLVIKINGNGRKLMRLGSYEGMGYIERVLEKQKIYRLSEFGVKIVSYVYYKANRPKIYAKYADIKSMESEVSVASTLGSIFG